jgi:predicted transcriptional regulator
VNASGNLDLRGDLQAEVMAIVWQLGRARVDEVRAAQPRRHRSAYTTIQTVMNRLAERGLLVREREGNAFVYRARYDEGDYLARTIGDRLADASPQARRAALVNLVDNLDASELDEVARYANRIRRMRSRGRES